MVVDVKNFCRSFEEAKIFLDNFSGGTL